MITQVPNIQIAGNSLPVYSIDYSNNGADSPSYLTATFVNSSGNYVPQKLNTENKIKVSFGNIFDFYGYPVSYSIKEEVSGNTITVKYQDDSIILDKIFVGLKGLHGPGFTTLSTGSFENMIFVGNQVDPCDGLSPDSIDPCDPRGTPSIGSQISSSDINAKSLDCAIEKLINIQDVNYNFLELISAAGRYVRFKNTPTINAFYTNNHTGSLREVLNAWCNEYGLTFLWNNGEVEFVDLKRGIAINDSTISTLSCRILSKTETRSIENVSLNANVFYVGLNGELKEYDNETKYGAIQFAAHPITLRDIFEKSSGELTSFIKKSYKTISNLETCCSLSKYSTKLRDVVAMKYIYGLNSVSDYKDAVEEKKKFPILGLEILEVIELGSTSPQSRAVSEELRKRFDGRPKVYKKLIDKKPFFIKCKYNETMHNKFLDLEKNLSDSFIGKYWFRFFTNGNLYDFAVPDANVNFYPRGSEVIFPFLDFLPESSRNSNAFVEEYVRLGQIETSGEDKTPADIEAEKDKSRGSFVMVERTPVWYPESGASSMIEKINNYIKYYHFTGLNGQIIDSKHEAVNVDGIVNDDGSGADGIFLIIPPSDLTVTSSTDLSHPIEQKNKLVKHVVGDVLSTYGLRDDKTKRFYVKAGSNKMYIYMPSQSYEKRGIDFSGYTVVGTRSGSFNYLNKFILEKIEVVFGNSLKSTNFTKLNLNFRDIGQLVIKYLETVDKKCRYSESEILAVIQQFKSILLMNNVVNVESVTKDYTVAGFSPVSKLNISDGLTGFSAHQNSQEGFVMNLSFSNIPKRGFSDSYLSSETERAITLRKAKISMPKSTNKV